MSAQKLQAVLTHGVIGNTAGFGPAILGSSPSGSTKLTKGFTHSVRPFLFHRKSNKDEKPVPMAQRSEVRREVLLIEAEQSYWLVYLSTL